MDDMDRYRLRNIYDDQRKMLGMTKKWDETCWEAEQKVKASMLQRRCLAVLFVVLGISVILSAVAVVVALVSTCIAYRLYREGQLEAKKYDGGGEDERNE